MAGDWVKMRVWLAKDPRVIAMADFLAYERAFMDWLTDPVRVTCDSHAYSHVTRHVTVAVTVTGLLQVWGVTREQGHRLEDDLLLPCASLDVLDQIAEVPRFGAALASVGWAEEREDEGCVVFPKFFRQQSSTSDRLREGAAERKRRQRERERGSDVTMSRRDSHANVTRDCHVTSHIEERRGEKRIEPPERPPSGTSSPLEAEPSSQPPTKTRKPKRPTWAGTIPPPLAGAVFPPAWERWLRFRKDELRKPVTQLSGDQALQELADWGPVRAARAIDHTIARGWQGIREPEVSRNGHGPEKTMQQELTELGL